MDFTFDALFVRGRSSFRTWLYRVVFNHLLNVKRGREELKITTFSAYDDALDNTPDLELPDQKVASPNEPAGD